MQKTRAILGVMVLAGVVFLQPLITRGEDSAKAPASDSTTELTRKLDDLQAQIIRVQAELAEAKKQIAGAPAPAASSAPAATPAPAAEASATAAAAPAPAEKPSPLQALFTNTSLSGFVDGYYGFIFNHPQSRMAPFRVFDGPTNQFSLNMVKLMLDRAPDASSASNRLGYRVSVGFGNAMNVVNGPDPGGLGYAQYLDEAYLSYLAPVGKNGLQFDFGKFVTPHGAEVIETKDNWNYSRGLLFGFAIPFYHFGLRTKYTWNSKISASAYIVNGWNNIVDNNTGKTYGVQLAWTPNKKFSLVQNYMAGPEQAGNNQNWRQLSDTLVTISPTDKLSFMVNYDYGRGDRLAAFPNPVYWTGVAGYVRYAWNDKNAFAARYEWFDDPQGFTTLVGQQVKEFTGTYEHKVVNHLITRFEYRHDYSNQPTFIKGLAPVSEQDTLAVGLILVFDSREP